MWGRPTVGVMRRIGACTLLARSLLCLVLLIVFSIEERIDKFLMRLHLEGLTVGYLSLNCLGFYEFGWMCVDWSEILKSGRRVSRACKNVEFGLKDMFLEQNTVICECRV